MNSKRSNIIVPALFIFVLLGATAWAAVIHVPGDYPAIQDAIDAAVDGDAVIVAPGTYTENIDFVGKAITVESSGGAAVTVIDGGKLGSVVTFQTGEGVGSVLEGFTVTNGYAIDGGGIFCDGAAPSIFSNIITANEAEHGGGMFYDNGSGGVIHGNTITQNTNFGYYMAGGAGIYLDSYSSPLINGNDISDNVSIYNGGGIYCNHGSAPLITDNVISGNSCSVNGGGILCENGSDATITDNVISGNSASSYPGGGIHIRESIVIVTGNTITGNSGYHAGGIYCWFCSSVTIEDNVISRNTAASTGGGLNLLSTSGIVRNNVITENGAGSGGAIKLLNSSTYAVITENLIADNEAYSGGAFIFEFCSNATISRNIIARNKADGSGGAFYCYNMSDQPIEDNIIVGNRAKYNGGVLYCDYSADPILVRNVLRSNGARTGGAICASYTSPTITSNVFSENRALEYGGAIALLNSPNPVVVNNVLWQNSADLGGGGIYSRSSTLNVVNTTLCENAAPYGNGGGILCDGTTAQVINSILWDNTAVDGLQMAIQSGSALHIQYSCCLRGPGDVLVDPGCQLVWGPGNLLYDPLFVEQTIGDLHLKHPSPCRNKGDGSITLPAADFEGDPRIAGLGVDMGADEFHPHLYHTGDAVAGGTIDIRIVDVPGMAPVRLLRGAGVLLPPRPTPYGDLYLRLPIEQRDAGAIPPSGVLTVPFDLPACLQPGDMLPVQALLGLCGSPHITLTNFMPVVVK
jgi:hypothetical protein